MTTIKPWPPYSLNWRRRARTCHYCTAPDAIPSTATVELTDRRSKPVCASCARPQDGTHDVAFAATLEALRQQLLAHDDHVPHLYSAADYLRGLADEIESLRADREVVSSSEPTSDGVTSHYDTRPCGGEDEEQTP